MQPVRYLYQTTDAYNFPKSVKNSCCSQFSRKKKQQNINLLSLCVSTRSQPM